MLHDWGHFTRTPDLTGLSALECGSYRMIVNEALRVKAKDGGRGRSRTDMRLPSADFESAVAANFTTRP